jgi:hypothetical protein
MTPARAFLGRQCQPHLVETFWAGNASRTSSSRSDYSDYSSGLSILDALPTEGRAAGVSRGRRHAV